MHILFAANFNKTRRYECDWSYSTGSLVAGSFGVHSLVAVLRYIQVHVLLPSGSQSSLGLCRNGGGLARPVVWGVVHPYGSGIQFSFVLQLVFLMSG